MQWRNKIALAYHANSIAFVALYKDKTRGCITKFEELNIDSEVLASLDAIGFKEPTRIQLETIPLIKEGRDIIGQSETGSGKTGAFGIPMVEKVNARQGVQALVLAPTRELALQIAGELQKFSRHKHLRIQCVYGGAPMGPQVSGIRQSEIIVGTPGRVLDHIGRGTLNLEKVKIFVLDEADKMIDMGFIEDIETIERFIPKERQTLLFSATMPGDLISITNRFTSDAEKIVTTTKVSEESLAQFYCDVDRKLKFSLLVHLIREEEPKMAIIFCNSRRDVDLVSKNLRQNGINAEALHGGLSQGRRERVLDAFHKRHQEVLVATDVAARGLDFKQVTHIFNYSVPMNTEEYVNRIGRTARAGESGKAIVLLSREDYDSFTRVVNTYNFDIKPLEYSDVEVLPFIRNSPNDRHGSFRDRNGFHDGRNGYHEGRNSSSGRRFGGDRDQYTKRSFSGGGETHSCADIESLQSRNGGSSRNSGSNGYRKRRYN